MPKRSKIDTAVKACLDHARATQTPYKKVSEFLGRLQSDPNWTEREIIDLQTRVIRALMKDDGSSEAG